MMFKKVILFLSVTLFFLLNNEAYTQDISLSGRVFSKNGEPIIGASVSVINSSNGTITDNSGYFNIKLKPGSSYVLEISHLSYKTKILKFKPYRDTFLSVYLNPLSYEIENVKIYGAGDFSSNNLSELKVPLRKVRLLPVILGENDLMKTIQIMPGIQPGLDGSSQLNIRGASPDLNLVLVDGIPIIYSMHSFGFLSVFNTDAIKDAKLYKGAIPASYTDLGSGVLDITLKEGSMLDRKLNFEVSPIAFKTSFNGYLIKNKLSTVGFIRKSIFGYIIQQIAKAENGKDFNEIYGFNDYNIKLTFKPNTRNTFSLSVIYNGDDYKHRSKQEFNINNEDILQDFLDYMKNNNKIIAFRWFSVLGRKTAMNYIIGYSQFNYSKQKDYKFSFANKPDSIINLQQLFNQNQIKSLVSRTKISYYLSNSLSFNTGLYFNLQKFELNFYSKYFQIFDTLKENLALSTTKSIFISPYFSFIYKGKSFDFNLGLTADLLKGDKFYYNYLSPRINLKYKPIKGADIQLSYSKLHQNNHVLHSFAVSNPADLIVASNRTIPPISSEVYDITFHLKLFKHFNFTVSSFYKTMNNLLKYKLGTDVLGIRESIDNYVTKGNGYSYGFEILLSRHTPKLDLWLSYTYSRSFRVFTYLNNGIPFSYRYDRPNVLSISMIYKFRHNWHCSFIWYFYSGHNITLPTQLYIPGFVQSPVYYPILYYSSINNIRTPPYHRLDIAFSYHKPEGHSYLSFGIYNVYNHFNPVYMEPAGDGKLKGIALFPFMPFVSYKLVIDLK